jgi:hypothetical protein
VTEAFYEGTRHQATLSGKTARTSPLVVDTTIFGRCTRREQNVYIQKSEISFKIYRESFFTKDRVTYLSPLGPRWSSTTVPLSPG